MKFIKACSATKVLIILAIFSTPFHLLASEPFMLVSEKEYLLQLEKKREQNKTTVFKSKSIFGTDSNSPRIIINSPTITSELYSPIRVEIKFKATDGAEIQINTLKVLYGWLQLDITDRIKQHAQISNTGIFVDNVKLPVGEHNLTIEIKDTQERGSEKEVSFEILTSG